MTETEFSIWYAQFIIIIIIIIIIIFSTLGSKDHHHYYYYFIITIYYYLLLRGDVVVRASNLQPRGLRFESRPLRSTCNPGQVVHTRVPLFTKQYKLVPAQAGS